MRTRAKQYDTFSSGSRPKRHLYNDNEEKPRTQPTFLNPERYPLHIANKKLPPQTDDEYIPKTKSVSTPRARWLSAIILVLYQVGSAPVMPILSRRLVDQSAHNTSLVIHGNPCFKDEPGWTNDPDASQTEVQDQLLLYRYATAIPAVLSSMLLGSYADVLGRRPILLFALWGSLFKLIFFILSIRFDADKSLFFVVFALDGLSGSSFVVLTTLFVIATDVHSEQTSRALWVAFLIGLHFLTISIVGFSVTEFLVPVLDTIVTSCLLVIPLVAAILLGVFLLPETFPRSNEGTLSPWNRLCRVFKIYTSEGTCAQHVALCVALLILSLLEVNVLGPVCIDTLYLSSEPFCWEHNDTQIYCTVRLAGQAMAAVLLLKLAYSCGFVYGSEKIAAAGILVQGASFLVQALAFSSWMIYIVPAIGFPGFVAVPIVQTAMSFLVGRHDQGALFGGIFAKEALSNVVAYWSLDAVYTQTAHVTRGAVYLILASISVLAFILFFPFFYLYKRLSNDELSLEDNSYEDSNVRAGKGTSTIGGHR